LPLTEGSLALALHRPAGKRQPLGKVRLVQGGRPSYSQDQLEAAIGALTDAERFREAERLVAGAAPKLQQVLASALESGGWFGESQEAETLKAATNPDPDERIRAVRTLLAEEARMGMMVGVAVGWALREELSSNANEGDS
jgi:hypothetical protein